METPLDVLSRAASLLHADDEKRKSETWFSLLDPNTLFVLCISLVAGFTHLSSLLSLRRRKMSSEALKVVILR